MSLESRKILTGTEIFEIFNNGKFYWQGASKRYDLGKTVVCDACFRSPIQTFIGWQQYDICLDCLAKIPGYISGSTKQSFMLQSFMLQSIFQKEEAPEYVWQIDESVLNTKMKELASPNPLVQKAINVQQPTVVQQPVQPAFVWPDMSQSASTTTTTPAPTTTFMPQYSFSSASSSSASVFSSPSSFSFPSPMFSLFPK